MGIETLRPLLVSAAEAARMLGVGHSLFYEMGADGRLGPMPIRFGRKCLWRTDELRQWCEDGCPPRCKWQGGAGQ